MASNKKQYVVRLNIVVADLATLSSSLVQQVFKGRGRRSIIINWRIVKGVVDRRIGSTILEVVTSRDIDISRQYSAVAVTFGIYFNDPVRLERNSNAPRESLFMKTVVPRGKLRPDWRERIGHRGQAKVD